MDQLRHLMYNPPSKPYPWDPSRPHASSATTAGAEQPVPNGQEEKLPESVPPARSKSGDSASSGSTDGALSASMQKNLSYELEIVLNRGHPNIVKLLDFFEDREFYYCACIIHRGQPVGAIKLKLRSGHAALWNRSRSV